MRNKAMRGIASMVLTAGLVALMNGCAVLEIQMTSSPDNVRAGEPVTFDIKITNHSQCPATDVGALLIAFIPAEELSHLFEVSPDAPPEIQKFFEELNQFFQDLCAGGSPELPVPPMFAMMSCTRGTGEMVCSIAGPLFAQTANTGSMTFAGLRNHVQCELDGISMRCELHIPLPDAATAAAGSGAAIAVKPLVCQGSGNEAICGVDDVSNLGDLAPGQMAMGQAVLTAQGAGGVVRNLVFAFSNTRQGVCKGGSDAGEACNPDDTTPCSGGTCEPAICTGPSANAGQGCDPAQAATDCPGGTCALCTDVPEDDFLPVACSTTNIAPAGVPTMSAWGLIGTVVALLLLGSILIRRRRAA